jgi:hypothetical protein
VRDRGESAPEPIAPQRIPVAAASEEDGCACCAPEKTPAPAQREMLTLTTIKRDEANRPDQS